MSGFDMYQNSGYVNNRNRKRTLILDIDDSAASDTHLGSGLAFDIQLFEPLIIDKHSEVYLDNCLTFNSNIAQTPSSSAFALKINEFNMNSNVASSSDNNNMFNSLIIPNDHKTVDNNHGAVVHKGKKFNYVCDINPQTIHSLSGKITDLAGSPIFHGLGTTNFFTYALTGIDSGNLDFPVGAHGIFTATTGFNSSTSGEFLVTHSKNALELHFSSNAELTLSSGPGAGNITFTGCSPALLGNNGSTSTTLTLTNGTGVNPDLTLVGGTAGRFIAEFSIISRE
jgi:hypothetical protein